MIKYLDKNFIFSPLGVFVFYTLASALAIMGFRMIFPGDFEIIANFSISWRLIRGFLDFLILFPALALSSLVIPFGFKNQHFESAAPFSPHFFDSIKSSIIAAIAAAAVYAFLFSLILPLARDHEANLRFKSQLYRIAKEYAQQYAARGEWAEASKFLDVSERIWPGSPDAARLRQDTDMWLQREILMPDHFPARNIPTTIWPGERQPVNATEALILAEIALGEERFFDAHWLATLGSRLAAPGSAEIALATRLTAQAWNGINSLEPNVAEAEAHRIYRMKREGYRAILAGEWVLAYYIFVELMNLVPYNPDVLRFFAISEQGVSQVAFFLDEMELALGRILTGAVFSLPKGNGRLVMRTSSLSTHPDSAEGIGAEFMAFDRDGRPLWNITTPYVKMLPFTFDSRPAVVVLLRALDRFDETVNYQPQIRIMGHSVPSSTNLVLEISWDEFLLLTKMYRGISSLSLAELRMATASLGNFGHLPEVFEVELLRRFAEPLFFLPLAFFTIVIGWRFRAIKRPLFMALPMLGILPLVFFGIIQICRSWISNLLIWAVLSMGFTSAAIFSGIGILVLLVLSLIVLAAQHSSSGY